MSCHWLNFSNFRSTDRQGQLLDFVNNEPRLPLILNSVFSKYGTFTTKQKIKMLLKLYIAGKVMIKYAISIKRIRRILKVIRMGNFKGPTNHSSTIPVSYQLILTGSLYIILFCTHIYMVWFNF